MQIMTQGDFLFFLKAFIRYMQAISTVVFNIFWYSSTIKTNYKFQSLIQRYAQFWLFWKGSCTSSSTFSVSLTNFIVWLLLLLKIWGMAYCTYLFPSWYLIKPIAFLSSRFATWPKKVHILRTKRALNVK